MKEPCVSISITLQPSLIHKLRLISKQEVRTLSGTVRVVLRDYVASYEQERGKLE